MILDVALFLTYIGEPAEAARNGKINIRIAPRKLIPAADAELKLDGALVRFFEEREQSLSTVEMMNDRQ